MAKKTSPRHAVTPATDPVLVAKALSDLKTVTKKKDPITPGLLKKWAMDKPGRTSILEDTYWGSVRWPKALGKPLGPSLASGFDIEHQWLLHLYYIDQETGQVVDKYTWVKTPRPSTWEGPEDPEHYRFRFMGHASLNNVNQLIVRLADAPWTSATPKLMVRHLVPVGYEFEPKGEPVVLGEFEVVQHFGGLLDIRRLG